MKKMKRLAALFLAVVMIMAMGMTAMAAGNNSIVIKGALDNAKYKAYKIFNVEQTGEGEEAGYTYTRPLEAKELGDLNGLFTVTKGSTAVYYTPKDKLTGSELADALALVAEDYALNTPEEVPAANGTATISGLEAGYYYVESDQGSVAMLRAVDGTEPTVITEKNSNTSWGDGGKKAYNNEGRTEEDMFYAIGDTIYYEVTYKNAVNFTKEGDETKKVFQYTAKDKMPEGVALDPDSVVVTITEKNGDAHSENTYEVKEGTTITAAGFEIVIPWAETQEVDEEDETTAEDFYYKNVPAEIKITYKATVTKDVNSEGAPLTNKAFISYNSNPFDETNPDNPGNNDVYTGSVTIQKFDGKNGTVTSFDDDATPLVATFKIYKKTATGREFLIQDTDTNAITWGTEEQGTPFTTTDGTILVKGLDKGTYYLKETVAPDGYNALPDDDGTFFEIAKGGSTDAGLLAIPKPVANERGAVLPSTGGIGTTIFYVVGGILVLGAAVLLITKKRMSARN